MRPIVVILIMFLIFMHLPVWAEEVILGTIVSADTENGKLVIRPVGDENSAEDPESARKPEDLTVAVDKNSISQEKMKPGTMVRLWGDYIGNRDMGKEFRVRKINSEPNRPRKDPTGVRSRIRSGSNRIPKRPPHR